MGDGIRFYPNRPVTRKEMVSGLLKAYELNVSKTSLDQLNLMHDVKDIAPWAQAGLAEAMRRGRIKGYPDSTIRPKKKASRAEIAQVNKKAPEKGALAIISRLFWGYFFN